MKRLLFLICAVLMLLSVGANPAAASESGEAVVSENESAPPETPPGTEPSHREIKLPRKIDESCIAAIKRKLDEVPYACALWYVDLETGLSLVYNPDRMFAGASLIKAEYLMMIFEMIESGKVSYDNLYTYTAAHRRSGTTKIPSEHNYGDRLSLREIIEYVVLHSDNTGYNMLQVYVRSYFDIFEWAKQRYGTVFSYEGCNWLNARGVAECWKEIYARWKAGDKNYLWYVSLLKEANENKFVKGGLPVDESGKSLYEVAHKYGMDINASDDAAIVFYKDRPYFLCILTDYIWINTRKFMNEVSAEVFKMHEQICSYDS